MTPRGTAARLIALVPGGEGPDYAVNMRARLSGNVRLTRGVSLLNGINADISPQRDTSDINVRTHLRTHLERDDRRVTTAAACRPMEPLLKAALTQSILCIFLFTVLASRYTLCKI